MAVLAGASDTSNCCTSSAGLPADSQVSSPPIVSSGGVARLWGEMSEMSEAPRMSLKWDFCTLADHLGQSLREAEDELRLEQAVYGLDARDERALQALLATRLSAAYEVAREVHYPSTKGKKLTHRMRCDLVLSPQGQPLRLDTAGPPGLFDPPSLCEPADALWLEVKVAY